MINVNKLSQELISAGVSTHGNCNSSGVVWDDNNKEIQNRADVVLILNAHNPAPETSTIRDEKYNQAGITSMKMILALWSKVMQNDSTDADTLQIIIDQVNLSIGQ